MAGETSARGERAWELGKQVRDRINNIDNPDVPPRASQKAHCRRDAAAGYAGTLDP
jgi:hypothetical protein